VVSLQYPFTPGVYNWHGIEAHAIGGRNRGRFGRLLTWVKCWRTLSALNRKYHPEAILTLWLTETAFIGKRFARRHGLRHLTWLQGQDARKENRYVRRVSPEPGSLIAISAFNAGELWRNHGIRAGAIVPNGINPSVFPAFNDGPRDIDVLGVGALIPLKNYEAFVRIIHELKKQHPSIHAVIAGEGPEARNLSDLAFRLGLQHNLKLVGALPHRNILELMSRSRFFLHPSTYEGLSTVLLEALYSGCTTLSLQPVSTETAENFFHCRDEEDLRARIQELYNHSTPRQVQVNDMRTSAKTLVEALLGQEKNTER
jgi:glycosyltransferase involved in cell wall biosynthesis